MIDNMVAVTIAIFCIGVIYQTGRLSARVDSLEEWRRDVKPTVDAMFTSIRHVEDMLDKESRT